MRADGLTVYVVDDDPGVRDSLGLMLGLAGYRTALFADAESFLAAWRPEWSGCLVADLRLPGKTGVELQAALRERGASLPVVIITAHGDVPSARTAFQAEAVDFIEKPFDVEQVKAAIEKAFDRESRRLALERERAADAERLAQLTSREREVLEHAARGLHAKEIAAALGISPRTVEVHKTHIMAKLGVRNVAELVRFALAAEPDAKDRAGNA
jgi:FixJ family two-component response regulator